MGLPTSREANHGAQSPIAGTTVDKIQDCIIGAKKPSLVRTFGPNGGGVSPLSPASWTNSMGTSPTQNYFVSGAATSFLVHLPCETGDRITGITVRAFGDGAVDCTFTAGYLDSSGVLQPLATFTDTNRAAAWGDAILSPWTNRTLLAGESLACHVNINAINYRIQKWLVSYDRL